MVSRDAPLVLKVCCRRDNRRFRTKDSYSYLTCKDLKDLFIAGAYGWPLGYLPEWR